MIVIKNHCNKAIREILTENTKNKVLQFSLSANIEKHLHQVIDKCLFRTWSSFSRTFDLTVLYLSLNNEFLYIENKETCNTFENYESTQKEETVVYWHIDFYLFSLATCYDFL